MIGIIFAMNEEIESFKKLVKIEDVKKIYDLTFYKTNINNNDCIFVKSEVGKVNSSRVCQMMIDYFQIKYIFNVGVAESISEDINTLDLVVSERLVQHDFDITYFNHEKGYIPNIGKYIMADKKLLSLIPSNVRKVTIASGDIFVTDEGMSRKIKKRHSAEVVEMEGAAISQVCYLCKVPFLIIRCICDSMYDNKNMSYDEFLDEAAMKSSRLLFYLIKQL